MSSIAFVDSIGAASLQSPAPAPANRFQNWTADEDVIGDRDVVVGTGASYLFEFRRDYCAAFDLPYLKAAQYAVALRLKEWLIAGGQVTVATADNASTSYTAMLRPGTTPSIQLTDRALMEYTMHVELKNAADAPMTASYGVL